MSEKKLRRKRHISDVLDRKESNLALCAEISWGTKVSEDEDLRFTFANRDSWPNFQELLRHLSKASKESDEQLDTETERAVEAYEKVVDSLLHSFKARMNSPVEEAFLEEIFVSSHLKGCVFVGHIATDLDSIAGAIGAAKLFGGIPAKSEANLNGEILYVLKEVAELEEPMLFDDIPGGGIPSNDPDNVWKNVCLVDHNEEKQMVKSLREHPDRKSRVVGLIDHHALSSSFSSDKPLFIDVRPWGSMSSIVAHMFLRNNKNPGKSIARLLMCAILSDTLNLQSVTTTDADRFAVAFLARIGEIENPDEVARLMFRAKTAWICDLGPYAMVRGDQKDFFVNGWRFGIAVLEVTTMSPVLQLADRLILELRTLKIEKGGGKIANELDFAFLFVVDVVKQCSVLLVCGGREFALASKAFKGCPHKIAKDGMPAPGSTIQASQTLIDVGPLVSRKAQFVPAFSETLNAGFQCHKLPVSSPKYVDDKDDDALRKVVRGGNAKVFLDDMQHYQRNVKNIDSVVFDGKKNTFVHHKEEQKENNDMVM